MSYPQAYALSRYGLAKHFKLITKNYFYLTTSPIFTLSL